jgi:hypothetical protein
MVLSEPIKTVAGCIAGLLCGALLVTTQFPAAGNDDSHITYWAAHALAEYGRILNFNGQSVEQSSSLAFVLLLATIEKLFGVEPPVAGWVASMAFAAGALIVVARLARRFGQYATVVAPMLLGSWLPFVYWSTSGMEMTLAALLGAVVVTASARLIDSTGSPSRGTWAGVVLALAAFVTVRPESPIVLLCTLALGCAAQGWEFFRSRKLDARLRLWRSLYVLAIACACFALLVAFRQGVFQQTFPNPASIKTGGFSFGSGSSYLMKGLGLAGMFFAAAAALGAALVARDAVRGPVPTAQPLVLGLGVATLGFVAASGGDWMPGARLLVPAAPALALLAAKALDLGGARRVVLAGVGVVIVLLNVRSAVAFGASKSNGSYRGEEANKGPVQVGNGAENYAFSELGNKAHRRDARLLGDLLPLIDSLKPTHERPVYLMSGQAGMVPYYVFQKYFGAVRFIDLFAITSSDLLPCLPDSQKRKQIHGVRLGQDYILKNADSMPAACGARRPQIVYSTGRFPDNLRKNGYVRTYQGPPTMEAFAAIDGRLLESPANDQKQEPASEGEAED